MEIFRHRSKQELSPDHELLMKQFFIENFNKKEGEVTRITLEKLRELKDKGASTEKFLDYLCQKQSLLLHGSIPEIAGNKLDSRLGKIFASNKSAIAIMRSLYSNVNVNLEYPYTINERSPLILRIHTSADGKFISAENGFVYIVNGDGFKNEPKGSWQFIKEDKQVDFHFVVETEKNDFKYPIEVINDRKKN